MKELIPFFLLIIKNMNEDDVDLRRQTITYVEINMIL